MLMALQWGAPVYPTLNNLQITPSRLSLLAEVVASSQPAHGINAPHVVLIGPKSDSGVVDDDDAKPFACEKCSKRFGTKSLLSRHRSIHEEKRHVSTYVLALHVLKFLHNACRDACCAAKRSRASTTSPCTHGYTSGSYYLRARHATSSIIAGVSPDGHF